MPRLALAPQLAARPWGGSPPRPLCQKICYQTAQKTALCAPCEHPGGFGIRKSASNSGHSPLRGLGGGLGDASPARRGSRSRTASPPAPLAIRKAPSASVESIEPRPPQPCQVGRPKGRRRKNRRQSHTFFLAPAAPGTPTRRHALGRLPTPPPLPENLLSDCTENCPLRPLRAPRRFRNPKIGQQLGAQPTPRFRVMLEALHDALHEALHDAGIDPWPPFTFCCPQAIVDEEAGV